MNLLTLMLLGCRWEAVDIEERGFAARATLAWSADDVLLVGEPWLRSGVWMMRRAGGKMETVYRRPDGFVAAADTSDAYAWVVFGLPRQGRTGTEFMLFRSADRGRTWSTAGLVPFRSMSQLEAVSDQELWVHATTALGRSVDGGATWDVVHAPGTRNGIEERLVAVQGEMQILGAHSLRSSDGGETWEPLGIEGELVATDGGWYLGEVEEQLAVRDPGGRWQRLPWSHPEARPLTLRVEGQTIQVLTTDQPEVGLLRWFESNDGGRTWRKGAISAFTSDPSWAIAPDGAIFAFPHTARDLRLRRWSGER